MSAKPVIPWRARLAAWWHESTVGHRVTMDYDRGRYRCLKCEKCNRYFHYEPFKRR